MGTLVPRGREKLEVELPVFSVLEYDNVIFGCAALYPFKEESMGEMACFSVDPVMQGMGLASGCSNIIRRRARREGKESIVRADHAYRALVPQTWICPGTVNDLPDNRQKDL